MPCQSCSQILQWQKYHSVSVWCTVSGAGEDLGDAAALTKLLGKERQLRDRNSQMTIHGKSFKRVLDLLGIAQREQARWKGGPAAAAPSSRPAEKVDFGYPPHAARFSA